MKLSNTVLGLLHIGGLMQERLNSSALAMELLLSYINPSLWYMGSMKTIGPKSSACTVRCKELQRNLHNETSKYLLN